MKMKRFLGILLSLAMVLGVMPGMSLVAYAEGETITVTWKNTDFSGQTHTKDGVTINNPGVVNNDGSQVEIGKYLANWTFTTSLGNFQKIEVNGGWTFNNANGFRGVGDGWNGRTWTGDSSSVSAYSVITDAKGFSPWTITFTINNVPVTGVTLNPSAAQSISVGGSVAFTATVAPDGATDKTVKWSTTGGVTLYSDENCTAGNEIGADATSTLTVYAKGTAAGSATVTAASNADSTKSASCNVTVSKADQTAPTGLTATKASSNSAADGKISGVTSAMEYQIDGASAWTAVGENKTEITDLAAGTYKVRYAETANENASPEATIQVGVKENQTAPTGLTATKASSSTATDGKISGVTAAMEYQIDGATTWTAVGENQTEITGLTAGTYKVRYAGTADKNASDATSVEVGVKEDQTAPTGLTATKASSSTATDGKISGVTAAMEYQKDGDTSWIAVGENKTEITGLTAGTYKVRYAGTADKNASPETTVVVGVKVTQTITASDVTATYGDTDKFVSASVTDPAEGKGEISYAVKSGSGDYIDVDATTGALTIKKVPSDGKAYVTVTAAGTAAYEQATKDVTVTISPKAMTVSASGYTGDYDEQPHGITVTVTDPTSGFTVKYGTEEGTYNLDSSPTQTEVGSKTVYYQVTAENYTPNTGSATVTINPKGSSGTPGEKTLVYNGTAQELVTAGVAEGGTMMYALGENASTAPEASAFTASIPTGVDAKTYYVWYMVKGDANHNDTKPACVEATIAKKGLTVTADAKSKTQGEADPALTYTADGLVGSDTLTGALSRDAGEDPGTYAINLGTLTAGDNYEITFISAVLTINKKEAPAPSGGGGSGGGGGYYGGGTVQNQRRDAYSDVIGAAATNFWNSSPERIRNIELAREKLDGIVLQPGEVFSFNEAVGVRTAEAGFEVAPVDPSDEATAEMGGGVSQVASTLYTGSLFALLETVERTNHPFAVPFIQPGTDAYVANADNGSGPDLKFRNTRGEPIRISAKTRVDEARQVREIVIELRSALGSSDYMPIRFDNTWGGDQNAFLTETPYDLTRPGYRILLTHEEQQFTDASGAGIRTLTHRKILDAAGMLVRDEILNQRLSGDSYAMDTYYQG